MNVYMERLLASGVFFYSPLIYRNCNEFYDVCIKVKLS
jgi:hypothetical protein